MANRGYVDIDLYGRGFDGIFGPGAEEENRRQAFMKFQAMNRFKERVKPGEYIDLDLYGRGDPRIFGRDSHIHTQNEAQKLLEEGQRRKKERNFNPLSVVFPPGIQAIVRSARSLIRSRSSSSKRKQHSQEDVDEVDNIHLPEDKVPPNIEPNTSEETHNTIETPEPLDETSIEAVDCTPKRVKSKLPSEEVRPHVEKGLVLRAIKSFSSFDKVENRTNAPGNVILADLARLEKYSSLPVHGTFLSQPPDSGSHKEVPNEIQDRHPTSGASSTADEIAKGILDGSDEEFQLSFSAPPQTVAHHTSRHSPSTSSEEDLLPAETKLEHIVLDEAGRSVTVSNNKIKDLFRSGDIDSGSEPGDAGDNLRVPQDDSRVAGDSKSTPQTSSSTEDEEPTENVVPVTGLSIYDLQVGEDDSLSVVQPVPENDNDVRIGMDSRGDSIIKIMDPPDISFNDHSQQGIQDDSDEMPSEVEAKGVSTQVAHAADNAITETLDRNAEIVVHKGTSSSGTSSSTAEYEDDGAFVEDVGNEQDSESAQDSDRSAEADSSSEVMTSSPEDDSDDVDRHSSDAETAVELVEDIAEVDGIEEIEVPEHEEREISDGGTAESSDHDDISEDDAGDDTVESDYSGNEDAAGDDGNNNADHTVPDEEDKRTFWQRLGLFGAVVTSSSWNMF